MKILLVSPGLQQDIDSRIVREIPFLHSSAFFAPHAVAAIAALTPAHHDISIHDEYMRGPVDSLLARKRYDIIGVSLRAGQLTRGLQIAELCRRGKHAEVLVAGGICTSMLSREHLGFFDVVFYGEAEQTWPRFLLDFEKGVRQPCYHQVSKPDMRKTPVPRWELIRDDIPSYGAVSVQTTRGCPFDCSFCDVIYTYGRKLRSKSVEQVIEEVRTAERLGAALIFFADDNFTADREYARGLLKELVNVNNSFRMPLNYMTQVDITVAEDDDLLELMADCNFIELMIGIESINPESLREMNKRQNLRTDIRAAVLKIQSYGIAVLAHLIFGADADDTSVFEQAARFVEEVNITNHYCHPLMAPPGTKCWYDLKRKGRIIEPADEQLDSLDITTWIVPALMSREELFEGLARHWEQVNHPLAYVRRAVGFVKGITRRPKVKRPGLSALWLMRRVLFEVVKYFCFQAGPDHRRAFFTVMKTAGRAGGWMVPRMVFLYTHYLMEYNRSLHNASIARRQIAWEKEHPEAISPASRSIPVPHAVRENAPAIATAAYERVVNVVSDTETLYRVVVEAFIDYSDRFGDSLERVDPRQLEFIRASCDRILAAHALHKGVAPVSPLSLTPPAGFAREILDAVDNELRRRELQVTVS